MLKSNLDLFSATSADKYNLWMVHSWTLNIAWGNDKGNQIDAKMFSYVKELRTRALRKCYVYCKFKEKRFFYGFAFF